MALFHTQMGLHMIMRKYKSDLLNIYFIYSIYIYNTRYLRYGIYPWILNEKYKNFSVFLKVRTRGYQTFFMLNSTEHDIYPAHNVKMPTNCWHFNIYEQDKYNIEEFKNKNNVYFSEFKFVLAVEIHVQLLSLRK